MGSVDELDLSIAEERSLRLKVTGHAGSTEPRPDAHEGN